MTEPYGTLDGMGGFGRSSKKSRSSFGSSVFIDYQSSADNQRVHDAISRGTLIRFYATWCGHCQSMHKEWKRLRKMRCCSIVDVESEKLGDFLEEFPAYKAHSEGFPTIIYAKGARVSVFNGAARTAVEFKNFYENSSRRSTGGARRRTMRAWRSRRGRRGKSRKQ